MVKIYELNVGGPLAALPPRNKVTGRGGY